MRRVNRHRSFHSKATKAYLLATTFITIVLLVSGIFSFQRQFLTIRELSISNIQLNGERIAFELERRIWQLADNCLQDPLTRNVLSIQERTFGGPQDKIDRQAEFAEVRRRHPIAGQLFTAGDGRFQFAQPVPGGEGIFLEHKEFVDAMKQQFKITGYHVPDRTYALALRSESRAFQVFYVRRSGNKESYVGIGADLGWIGSSLLSLSSSSALGSEGLANRVSMELREVPPGGEYQSPEDELTIGFETVLPFWQLRLPLESLDLTRTAIRREMWFIGLSVLMIASVLILEVFLFFRIFPELHIIQVRSDFISRVSHELRTPLTLIRLYAETLTETSDLSKEERDSYCHIINRETERLTQMINNVLQFSRIDKGYSKMVEGDLAVIVSRAIEAYRRLLVRDGFSIQVALPSNLPPVRSDPEEVTQAVLNLLDNARKYSGDSRLIEVRMWEHNAHVIIEVADNGMGVSPEQASKIFEPFYRSPNGGGQAGVGLGLYIVRNIMQAHGGRVEVESTPDEGSRFRLVFPALKGQGRMPAPSNKEVTARRKILG